MRRSAVSNLLSKPKSWQQLTARRREQYRKMNAWLSDPEGISQVKRDSTHRNAEDKIISSSVAPPTKNVTQKRKSLIPTASGSEPPKKVQVCV